MEGLFITLEGTEGVGKSTNLQYITSLLSQEKIPHLVTREPGGTEVSEAIRNLLLDKSYPKMCAETELLLLFAARSEHLYKVVLPALSRGEWVVSDRYIDSTYAYQGAGRGVDDHSIAQLEQWLQHYRLPDLTILLDLSPETGAQRVNQRGDRDRFEEESSVFFQDVRERFLQRARRYPDRIQLVNAALPLVEVQQGIAGILQSSIERWRQHV